MRYFGIAFYLYSAHSLIKNFIFNMSISDMFSFYNKFVIKNEHFLIQIVVLIRSDF